jgi:hypothetical protein
MASLIEAGLRGFEAGQASEAQAAQMAMDQRRIDLAQKREEAELTRQSNLDKLSVLNERATSLAAQARPHLAYMNTPPVDPQKDPEGYQKWLDSDEFKMHHKSAEDIDSQVGDLYQQKTKVQDSIIGAHTQSVHDQAKLDMAEVMSGSKSITDLPPERVADIFAVKSKMDPSMFVANDKTGAMPIDHVNNLIQEGIQTGNWQGKNDAVAALVPELHMAINHPMAGGTVTGVSVYDVHMNPNDKNLHFQPVYQVHMPDGSTKMVKGKDRDESMPVSLEQIGKRATLLQQVANLAKHPDLQSKIKQSFDEQTTAFHRLNNDLLAAGVPQHELLPAPYTPKEIPRGGKLAFLDAANRPVMGADGKPLTIEGNPVTSTAEQREVIADELQKQDPNLSREEAIQRASLAVRPIQYHGGLVTSDSTMQAPAGRGAGAQKYTAADKTEYENNLKQAVADRFGADLSDLDPKEDPINRLPKEQQAEARHMFNGARIKMRNDMRNGKEVDPEGYLPKKEEKKTAPSMQGPVKPKGTVWTSGDGKTKRISLGNGQWQTQQ